MLTLLVIALSALIPDFTNAQSLDPTHNNEVNSFLKKTSQDLHIPYDNLSKHFNHLNINDKIINHIHAPFESKPWHLYKKLVVTNKRIDKGLKFYKKYHKEIHESAKKHQIPVHILLGIIGIESNFTENLGQYNALQALATLSFSNNSRQKFFRSELKALFKMENLYHFNIDNFPSSYAGALGMIQFMPSSYLEYAKSQHNYMSPDIFYNVSDSVLSIGNFLKNKCHWQTDGLVAARWRPNQQHDKKILNYKFGTYSMDSLKKDNITIPKHLRKGAIDVAIMNGSPSQEFWVLYPNANHFKCYNNSIQYVIATNLLGKAIMLSRNHS
ncbi:MAG TPA: lytic murein transglycosylase [Gammaproteobacteria bacterium]|nr:lytic murein transglycosylase [Gammaproteobacteria bacterium]